MSKTLDELTVGEVKQLLSLIGQQNASHSLPLGKNVIIRTVTHYYTGHLAVVTDSDLVLEKAAWIADTGRWHDALKSGTLNEVEPFIDPVIIPRGGIIDITEWRHPLPKDQK